MTSSFRTRLTVRWTIALGIVLGLANLAIYLSAHVYVHRWLDGNVRTVAATEAASSTDGLYDVHLHEWTREQLAGGEFTEKFVQIFDGEGRLVLQSTRLGNHPPVIPPDVLQEALAGKAPLITLEVQGRQGRAAVLRATRDGRPFAVAVGLFSDDVERGLGFLAWLLVVVWVLGLVVTAAVGYVLASRALAPVAAITGRASWIANGHFSSRLDPPQTEDEIGRMTILLNSMLDRLQGAVEANRRFAADASHELRGPLTAIAGEVDVSLRHPRSAEEYRETLRLVRERLDGLKRIAEDLMVLVRAQEGARDLLLRETALAPVVDESFARFAALAASRSVSLSHDGLGGIDVYADRALFTRVIDNVIANAVLYNREGGTVRVTAGAIEAGGDWEAPMVEIRVADSGAGIPPSLRERVFERFFRVDQSRARHTGGSGLGLAICAEVLSMHGGTIRVAETSPAGTVMEIRMPGRIANAPAGAGALVAAS